MPIAEKIAAALLPKLVNAAVDRAFKPQWDAAWTGIYRQWQDTFQSPDAREEAINDAYADFFAREPVIAELAKLGRDQYSEIDFDVLVEQLRESFEYARCPLPIAPDHLHDNVEAWLRDLKRMLEENPSFRREHGLAVQKAVRDLDPSRAALENDSLARRQYLASVTRLHRHIRFSGMAEIGNLSKVEMERVFVMPRLARRDDGFAPASRSRQEPEPIQTARLLAAPNAPTRLVLLGSPGTGKTTLLEALALAFAKGADFPWAATLPPLLPVFCRIRDLATEGGAIWDRLHQHASNAAGITLPRDFFRRRMDSENLIFLFDGLDEAAPGRRGRIVDLLDGFAANLPRASRLIITSRPYDYRYRFDYPHYDLCEFDESEMREFIQGWCEIHEPNPAERGAKAERLWQAIESGDRLLPLARNALLLTMIVRVHFGLGALPDSRLGLYAKCAETLLKHWTQAKGLAGEQEESPVDYDAKDKLLQRLAFEMQGEAGDLSGEVSLQIPRADLARRLKAFMEDDGCPSAYDRVEKVIERLHTRDAILVKFGTDDRGQDRFGFVHRSFQEYFAARYMAEELPDDEFQNLLVGNRPGWNETLYLAVAQLKDRPRRRTLQDLLKSGRAAFALECLKAAKNEERWLDALVRFLSRYTWIGRSHALPVAECADRCGNRAETGDVLAAMFQPENREGQSLVAAVELAGELAGRGDLRMKQLLDGFFLEAADIKEDMVTVAAGRFLYGRSARPIELPAFKIDRYLVTNADYERMVPGHRALRDKYSDSDRQPVIHVSWHEANLYSRWRHARLPTEQEWEKAASWDAKNRTKRTYPWGEKFDAARCNTEESGLRKTTPVGAYPSGRSFYECEDMAGNVWEWTASPWEEGSELVVVRGGSWYKLHHLAACAYRYYNYPYDRFINFGFRCART